MKLNIHFSMPELLVVYSFLMYNHSWSFATAALFLGISGRVIHTMVEYGKNPKEKVDLDSGVK